MGRPLFERRFVRGASRRRDVRVRRVVAATNVTALHALTRVDPPPAHLEAVLPSLVRARLRRLNVAHACVGHRQTFSACREPPMDPFLVDHAIAWLLSQPAMHTPQIRLDHRSRIAPYGGVQRELRSKAGLAAEKDSARFDRLCAFVRCRTGPLIGLHSCPCTTAHRDERSPTHRTHRRTQ